MNQRKEKKKRKIKKKMNHLETTEERKVNQERRHKGKPKMVLAKMSNEKKEKRKQIKKNSDGLHSN